MKILCSLTVIMIFQQAIAGIVRKPPAFATPVYSNSYLPAAMQVIFHAVEQLNLRQMEEIFQQELVSSLSTTQTMRDQQPQSTTPEGISIISTATTAKTDDEKAESDSMISISTQASKVSSQGSSKIYDDSTEITQRLATSTASVVSNNYQQSQLTTSEGISTTTTAKIDDEKTESNPTISTQASKIPSQGSSKIYDSTEITQRLATSTASVVSDNYHKETPEVNEETTETNYELPATPETNHELPEPVQETQEPNQEVSEKSEEKSSNTERSFEISKTQTPQYENALQQQPTQVSVTQVSDDQKKKESTVDSVVDKIYGIVKTTTSLFSEESGDEFKSVEISIESEKIEDEEEETRFSLLGERVAQVPRPSLNHYLRRSKVPSRPSLQQLANLYDALSKDARKQGFARFAGFGDDVLKILQSSAEGGIKPQLKQLLEKVVERNELTRDDAKNRTSQAMRDLDDPASALSQDLNNLLPLRYTR